MRHITYSIPTRNRPENLKSVLLRLLPQLDSSSVVNVIDNASDIFAESIVNDVREHLGSDVVINVFRNEVDLGGSANVLKCFEYCNTQWNYIVGDSKLPTESAVSTVLHDIGTFNDCLFINYYYESEFHSVRDQSEIVYGVDSLLDKMGSFGNMILLGNTVYNNERVKKYLSVGYQYAGSFVPQFVLLIAALQNKEHCAYLSNNVIIDRFLKKPDSSAMTQTIVDCWVGFSQLSDIVQDNALRGKLNKSISGYSGAISMDIMDLLKVLFIDSVKYGRKHALYYLTRSTTTFFYYGIPVRSWLLVGFAKIFFSSNLLHSVAVTLYERKMI